MGQKNSNNASNYTRSHKIDFWQWRQNYNHNWTSELGLDRGVGKIIIGNFFCLNTSRLVGALQWPEE